MSSWMRFEYSLCGFLDYDSKLRGHRRVSYAGKEVEKSVGSIVYSNIILINNWLVF